MKKFNAILAILILILCSQNVFAAAPENHDENSTKLNLWIPGFLVKMVAEIAEDHVDGQEVAAVDFLHKFGSISLSVREGEYYQDKTDKKMTRKLNRMDKYNYEDLIAVKSADANVNICIRENKKGKIKRLVVLVDEPGETYAFIKVHCRISADDIKNIVTQYPLDI